MLQCETGVRSDPDFGLVAKATRESGRRPVGTEAMKTFTPGRQPNFRVADVLNRFAVQHTIFERFEMSKRLWVLGAADVEMAAIEKLLTECGETFCFAVGPDGQRVHPGNAYSATMAEYAYGDDNGETVIFVECAGGLYGVSQTAIVVDHHRPGDPGFGRPSAEFFAASSVGQVASILAVNRVLRWESELYHRDDGGTGPYPTTSTYEYVDCAWNLFVDFADCEQHWLTVPQDIVMTAAADHCLAAAYRGECLGVDPDALMRWRVEQRAAFQKRSVKDVLHDVEAARSLLEYLNSGDGRPVDVREVWTSTCDCGCVSYSNADDFTACGRRSYGHDSAAECNGWSSRKLDQPIPELPEAAVREGVAYLATVTGRDGRVKDVLGGHTTPELVQRWMDEMKAVGRETYGDPVRGFAGAYRL